MSLFSVIIRTIRLRINLSHLSVQSCVYTVELLATFSIASIPSPLEFELPKEKIELFGVLAMAETQGENGDYHICLKTVERGETLAIITPCCTHPVHSKCFWKWLFISATENADSQPRCAHFKTIYVDMQHCFLCQCLKQTVERLVETWCGQSTIYATCVSTICFRLLKNCRLITLACGRTIWRGCHWTGQSQNVTIFTFARHCEK